MIAAAAVVATGALAGVHFDADAAGRALLGWNQSGQVRWVEVVDGKPLAKPRVLARATLGDLDVAPERRGRRVPARFQAGEGRAALTGGCVGAGADRRDVAGARGVMRDRRCG